MHADSAFSIKCSKLVEQLLERLEFEFPVRIRTDLVRAFLGLPPRPLVLSDCFRQLERSTVVRCALGFFYCSRGEFQHAGAVLNAASENLRQVDGGAASTGISKLISPHAQLILSTVLWSVLGRTVDFNWAVRTR